MNNQSESPDSYYLHSANNITTRRQLTESVDADVCVIGGGYTGLLTALNLAEKNYKVVLLEARKVGWGASGRNGGQVGSGHNKKINDLNSDEISKYCPKNEEETIKESNIVYWQTGSIIITGLFLVILYLYLSKK